LGGFNCHVATLMVNGSTHFYSHVRCPSQCSQQKIYTSVRPLSHITWTRYLPSGPEYVYTRITKHSAFYRSFHAADDTDSCSHLFVPGARWIHPAVSLSHHSSDGIVSADQLHTTWHAGEMHSSEYRSLQPNKPTRAQIPDNKAMPSVPNMLCIRERKWVDITPGCPSTTGIKSGNGISKKGLCQPPVGATYVSPLWRAVSPLWGYVNPYGVYERQPPVEGYASPCGGYVNPCGAHGT